MVHAQHRRSGRLATAGQRARVSRISGSSAWMAAVAWRICGWRTGL